MARGSIDLAIRVTAQASARVGEADLARLDYDSRCAGRHGVARQDCGIERLVAAAAGEVLGILRCTEVRMALAAADRTVS